MIKRKLFKSILISGIILAVLLLSMCSGPGLDPIAINTPTISPEPTPSPTPKVDTAEDETQNALVFLGFDVLQDYLTMSQYNYLMLSIEDYFNALYQANIRSYQFSQFQAIQNDLLNEKFMFANDEEAEIPYDMFAEVYVGDDVQYRFILDAESFVIATANYRYNIDLYIANDKAATFAIVVNKKTLQVKIK